MRAALITAAIVLVLLFLYAQMVRRSSMFFPSKFPEGAWTTTATDVHFKTSDGVQLHGWLFKSGEPLLIFFHGNGGNITGRAPIAAELARRGISVLLFDWRGYGKSEGSASESGLFFDALAAYDFARTLQQERQHLDRLADQLNPQAMFSQFPSIGIKLERPEAKYLLASGCNLHRLKP